MLKAVGVKAVSVCSKESRSEITGPELTFETGLSRATQPEGALTPQLKVKKFDRHFCLYGHRLQQYQLMRDMITPLFFYWQLCEDENDLSKRTAHKCFLVGYMSIIGIQIINYVTFSMYTNILVW